MTTELQTRIAEVLALADKATPGPWQYDDGITNDETGDRGKPQCVASVNLGCFGRLVAEPYGREPDGHESDVCVPSLAESDANGLLIAALPKIIDLLRQCDAEIEQLREALGKRHAMPVGPDRCPFTGHGFWGNITHPDLGEVATYGGPYDTYTIPQRTDDDPDYCVYRFDQDGGYWVDSMESIGFKLVDDQLYTSEDDPEELRRDAERYRELNTPEIADFLKAVEREALHQRDRWGVDHDAGKTRGDWMNLIVVLLGKAVAQGHWEGRHDKLLHHIITAAAALLNWHAAEIGASNTMRPGVDATIAKERGESSNG